MSPRTQRSPPVKSVDTAFRIIETIRQRNGSRPKELSEDLNLPTSTLSDYLVTLHDQRYLVKRGDEYRVGLRFLELGDQARSNHKLYQVGQEKIDNLAEQTGELVHLSMEQDGLGIIIYEREGSDAISLDTYVGRQVQLHCTALGKAMLAFKPPGDVEKIINRHGLEPKTDNTILDRDRLMEDLERVRERGFAVSRGERIEGLGCLAVSVEGIEDGEVLGALSICAPLSRTEPDGFSEELVSKARKAAGRIELDLAFD